MPLLAPVMRAVFPCMASGPHGSARRHEHIDEIAVRIPKQHRPIAPGLISRRLDPFADAFLQAGVMRIDVPHLEIEDEPSVGAQTQTPPPSHLTLAPSFT